MTYSNRFWKAKPSCYKRMLSYVHSIYIIYIRTGSDGYHLRKSHFNFGRKFEFTSLWLRLNYYTPKMQGHKQQWISHKMNNWHPWQLKKSKSWGPFWSYQLSSTANPAHLRQNWAKLAMLFSWQLQNGSQDFNFFNCHGCR